MPHTSVVEHLQGDVERALAQVIRVVDEMTTGVGGRRMTLAPDASESQVLEMLWSYGRAHLFEAAEALMRLPGRLMSCPEAVDRASCFDLRGVDSVIEINCGAAATAALVALATQNQKVQVRLVDYAPAACAVGTKLLNRCGIHDVSRHVVTSNENLFQLESGLERIAGETVIVFNHAANVNWSSPSGQQQLLRQNQYVLRCLAEVLSPKQRLWLLFVDTSVAQCLPDQLLEPLVSEFDDESAVWSVTMSTITTRVKNQSSSQDPWGKKSFLYALEVRTPSQDSECPESAENL